MRQLKLAAAFAAAAVLFAGAPASASPGDIIDIIVGEGDLLDRLIALDAEGIADMRDTIADARVEIERAADDIRFAREEAAEGRGNRLVVLALSVAAEEIEQIVGGAVAAAYVEIDDAERRLVGVDLSPEERNETQSAIDGLRIDLADVEAALGRLMETLKD